MNDFLGYNDIIAGFSPRNETSLERVNQVVEKRLEAKDQNFRDHFV
jgi:hypothetical protein